jgi:hypothetical protein
MEQAFENHNRNITSAIAHVYTFQSQLPADFMKANHELTTREKNEIIRDILYPF